MYQNANAHLAERFEDWWNRDNKGLPLMNVIAVRDGAKWQVPKPNRRSRSRQHERQLTRPTRPFLFHFPLPP